MVDPTLGSPHRPTHQSRQPGLFTGVVDEIFHKLDEEGLPSRGEEVRPRRGGGRECLEGGN